jgi:Lon protease-like protein
LFPLVTVLLPGGLLPLRIFEPRYIDLIGHCMRHGELFGVVQIRSGTEIEVSVSVQDVGTSARVIDFHSTAQGLLSVLCRGERRFRILSRQQQPDGLNRASIQWLPEPAKVAPAPQFAALAQMLRKALAHLTLPGRFIEPRYDDADWVSCRLAELLPLTAGQLQQLLELDDPQERLRRLAPLLEDLAGG